MAGLNRILNKIIKTILEAITIPLVNITTTYLFKNKILNCYKKTIIVVLQKVNKKDYLLLRSYWPVALKNTLGKILKKIIAECIQKAIKV